MKKRIASLLLALPLCLTLLPTTALAEDEAASDRTVIATVEDLQQFARAVDAGDYDGKTDAVVELAADLDLTGIEWTPIGSTVNELQRQILWKRVYDFQFGFFRKLWKDRVSVFRIFQ